MTSNSGTKDSLAESSIFEAVKECIKQIEAYTTSDRPHSRKYATTMQGKLEVWARYSGATSRPGVSLDDRLSALPVAQSAVLGLLFMITMKVRQALELPDTEIDNSTDASRIGSYDHDNHEPLPVGAPSSTPEIDIQEIGHQGLPWEAINKAIDSLFKLTAAIRNSDKSNGDAETPAHYSRPDDLYFEEMAKLFVRRCYPHARRALCDQLGHAVYIRRRKILYRQRHEEKLQFQRSFGILDPTIAETTALPDYLSATLNVRKTHQPEQLKAKENQRFVAPSLTQFSQLQTQSVVMRRVRAATVVTGRTKGSVVLENTEFNYPDPPTDPDDHAILFCPYCCEQLNLSQLKNWRRHIDLDLKPFVCMSESCQDPPRLFSFQSDWLQHMAEYHGNDWYRTVHMTTWFCNIGHEEQQEFVNVDEFRKHLSSHELSRPKQNVLIRHNQALGSRASGVCPLCEEAPLHEDSVGVRALFDHIANHLRRIALVALPAADVQSEVDDDSGSFQSGIAMVPESFSGPQYSMSRSSNRDTPPLSYEVTGRVLATGPPGPDHPSPPPPPVLLDSLSKLAMNYPGDLVDVIMRYTAVSPETDLPIAWQPDAPVPPGTKFYYSARIRCHDCPGKLYTPDSDLGVSNFEVHLKNRLHRERVNARLIR